MNDEDKLIMINYLVSNRSFKSDTTIVSGVKLIVNLPKDPSMIALGIKEQLYVIKEQEGLL